MRDKQIQKNGMAYLLLFMTMLIGITMASVRMEKKLQLSSKRAYFSTIQADDRIFFVGGFERQDTIASSVIDVYNLTSGSWEKPLNLTTPRGRISLEILGPRIYMVGGYDFNPTLYNLNTDTQTFTSTGFTNRPTVRTPVSMILSNTTLTVVGSHSIDFMDLATKNWTHNEKLTSITWQLFNTTIVPIRNFVFVMGGIDGDSLVPSTSIWMINSTTGVPIQFSEEFPVNTTGFIGSWFDDNHNVAVIQYTNRCFVYHAMTQRWYQRETANNTVASVSFLNSTMVFFSDGYWTLNWTTMSSAWTSLDQVTFAFTIADQLVYCASNQVSVVTSLTSVTQPTSFGTPFFDVAMSPTVRVFLNSTGALFMYSSATKQLVLVSESIANFTPSTLFRINDTMVYVIGVLKPLNQYWVYTLRNDGLLTNFSQIPFIPDVLVQNYFYRLDTVGQYASASNPLSRGFGIPFVSPVWTQLGDTLFVIELSSLQSTLLYNSIDVYNYVEDQWEESIPVPKSYQFSGVLPTAVLNDSLCILTNVFGKNQAAIFWLNETNLFDTILFTRSFDIARSQHPTYMPTVVMNNSTAYLCATASPGVVVVSSTGASSTSQPGPYGIAQQVVKKDAKIFLSAAVGIYFPNIYIYNTDSDIWRSVTIPSSNKMASIALYDDYLLVIGDDLHSIDYLDLTTEIWYNQLFNTSHVPASMFTIAPTTSSDYTTLLIAGGYHKVSGLYTDEVLLVSFDFSDSTPIVIEQPLSDQIASPIAEDTSTMIIAVVIPVGVVVIAAVLLTVLLIRRKRQRRHGTMISMTGLEQQQFGQWFVPYEDITFQDQLGQGAGGQVFKGKWKNTDVALKISMATANQSVMSELSVMIALRPHPNVVQLFGFSVHPETNSIILILEYCNGGSLADVAFSSEVSIDLSKQIYWLKSVCKGIGHLHSNNIVHRDIAARNVLLHQGEPKLTDFGLSRLVDEQQHGTTKSELGPIRWMAPESIRDKKYSPKSDVWSFGILMFEVLERREPHLDEDPITIGMKIRDQGVIPELPLSSGYPSELISTMKQCCQMSPESRPTIDQVLEKLEHIPI